MTDEKRAGEGMTTKGKRGLGIHATDPGEPRERASRLRGEKPAEPRTDTGGLDEAMAAIGFALDKKAVEPVLLDVRELCSYCNYQLVLSGRSDRQVDAIADAVVAGLRGQGVTALGTERAKGGAWSLLDFGDLLVHVFHHPAREHYDLEGLWIDAPRVELDLPAEARLSPDDAYA
jgi:ribosome-associated protein